MIESKWHNEGGCKMIPHKKTKERKWTNRALFAMTLIILIYVTYTKGFFGITGHVTLETTKEIIQLEEKKNTFVGVNNKQVIKVTGDGINAYNFQGTEIWSDTFSMNQFTVQQEEPYVAVAEKKGKQLILFNEKGRQAEIITTSPIVYFSVNEKGGLVTIESGDNLYTITAYDEKGKSLCQRVSYVSSDGYPTAAVLSPDYKRLMMSYVSVDDPQVTSSILAMEVEAGQSEEMDPIAFGYIEKNNLVYKIEYMDEDTWVCIGDKAMTWYGGDGRIKGKQDELSLVFTPERIKGSLLGTGCLPVVYTDKAAQSVVHRQDKLAYFDHESGKNYDRNLEGGVESLYTDASGVIVEVGGIYKGFDKLCNPVFDYSPVIDISKVIYNPSMKKGIAVGKDKVFLLTPKKEKK